LYPIGEPALQVLFAEPHEPLTDATLLAEHEALEPAGVPVPLHDHDQGPEPLTPEGLPAEHRLLDGAVAKVPPLAEPHAPFSVEDLFAEQEAVGPLPAPQQYHDQGPEPPTPDALPDAQRFDDGAET